MAERPKLVKVDAEMRRWCAMLEEELAQWPEVTSRSMFGLESYYRDSRIFAAIPRTRAVETPFSLLIKLPRASDARLRTGKGPGAGWVTFAMESEADIGRALEHLGRAYEKAGRGQAAATSQAKSTSQRRRKR